MPRKSKNKASSTLQRQWTMLRAIPRLPRVIGTSELIARLDSAGFNVDLRTIQRDLNSLSEVLPLASDQHKPQGWSWLPNAGQFDIPGLEPQAALAFLISGAGTSVGAIAGALTIARWRVIALVVGTLWIGAVLLGYAYDFLLAAHLI